MARKLIVTALVTLGLATWMVLGTAQRGRADDDGSNKTIFDRLDDLGKSIFGGPADSQNTRYDRAPHRAPPPQLNADGSPAGNTADGVQPNGDSGQQRYNSISGPASGPTTVYRSQPGQGPQGPALVNPQSGGNTPENAPVAASPAMGPPAAPSTADTPSTPTAPDTSTTALSPTPASPNPAGSGPTEPTPAAESTAGNAARVIVAPARKRWGSASFDDDDANVGFSAAGGDSSHARTARPAAAASNDTPAARPDPDNADPTALPIHQRMQMFRQSAFGNDTPATSSTANSATGSNATGGSNASGGSATPASPSSSDTANTSGSPSSSGNPSSAGSSSDSGAWSTPAATGRLSVGDAASSGSGASGGGSSTGRDWLPRSTTTDRSSVSGGPAADRAAGGGTTWSSPAPAASRPSLSSAPTASARTWPQLVSPNAPLGSAYQAPRAEEKREAAAKPNGGVLLTRQSPVLNAQTTGPRKIIVGRESVYEISLSNSADVSADEVVVFVELPAWAEVQGAETSVGGTQMAPAAADVRQLQWAVGHLEARSRERLTLRLIPRESRPFDLAIHWDFKQTASQTMIEVQEPKLAVHLQGPHEVLFGKKEIYKLKVNNTGTGDAENVVIRLYPLGGDEAAATHAFGTLPPGEERTVEVELLARQAGALTVKVEVQCDGGVRAEAAEPVLVRRAGLRAEVDGPRLQFVDSVGTYRIHVVNPGTATARQITVTAAIPQGMKYISGSEGAQTAQNLSAVRWRIDGLSPNAEKIVELKCGLTQPGNARLDVTAVAEDDLSVTAATVTRVETMADLVMEVIDPAGPIPVGDEATYELRILNRGTRAAEEIDVAAFFSQGIEPTTVQGAPHRLAPGQVSFNTIPSLGPGRELRLKINAKAQVPGAHVFRAEVHCRPLGSRLVREETTQFYATDSTSSAATSNDPLSAHRSSPDSPPARTAARLQGGFAPGNTPTPPNGGYAPPSGYAPANGYAPPSGSFNAPYGNAVPTRVYR